MIAITSFYDTVGEPSVEYDPYTPVTITWPQYRRSLDAPTSVGLNGDGGYLELKLDSTDGTLQEIVLVSAVTQVRDEALPVAAFQHATQCPVIALSSDDHSKRNHSGDLPLPQIAFSDGLEIRLSGDELKTIVPGSRIGFGVLEDGGLAAIYLHWNSDERASFIESSNVTD